jgi:hypothetical protein
MINFNMEYKVNGRSIPAERFGDEFMAAIMEQMIDKAKEHFRGQTEDRIADLRCKVHNQEAHTTVDFQHDRSTQRFTGAYHVEGCYQKFIDEVANLMAA